MTRSGLGVVIATSIGTVYVMGVQGEDPHVYI